MDAEITLIKEDITYDDIGNPVSTTTTTDLTCEVASIGGTEFFRAATADIKAEFVFYIFCLDYNGEKLLEYNGKTYRIYRTFLEPEKEIIELYARSEVGT